MLKVVYVHQGHLIQVAKKKKMVLSFCHIIQGISEKIARSLNVKKENIKVAYKPIKSIGSMFKKPKDKVVKNHSIGVIYEIACKQCDKVYIGQRSRALKTQTKEHKQTLITDDKNSLIAAHCRATRHDFDFENLRNIDRNPNWHQRTLLATNWHSLQKPTSINEHIRRNVLISYLTSLLKLIILS